MSLIRSKPKGEDAAINVTMEWLSRGRSTQRICQKLCGEFGYDEEKTVRILQSAAKRLVAANCLDQKELFAINVARAEHMVEMAFESGDLAMIAASMRTFDAAIMLPVKFALTSRQIHRTNSGRFL